MKLNADFPFLPWCECGCLSLTLPPTYRLLPPIALVCPTESHLDIHVAILTISRAPLGNPSRLQGFICISLHVRKLSDFSQWFLWGGIIITMSPPFPSPSLKDFLAFPPGLFSSGACSVWHPVCTAHSRRRITQSRGVTAAEGIPAVVGQHLDPGGRQAGPGKGGQTRGGDADLPAHV